MTRDSPASIGRTRRRPATRVGAVRHPARTSSAAVRVLPRGPDTLGALNRIVSTEAEPPQPISLLPVFLIVLVDVFGMTLVIPLLTIYAESFDATPLQAT